jgi:hypothetical protein
MRRRRRQKTEQMLVGQRAIPNRLYADMVCTRLPMLVYTCADGLLIASDYYSVHQPI